MATLVQLVDDVVANKFEIREGSLTIGRHPNCNIQIQDSAVSGNHAKLEAKRNEHFPQFLEYFLSDLDSTNGTYINEKKLTKRERLRHNDVVRIAWNTFKFIDDKEAELERTTHIIPSN
ncbi:FHA domain-containing protein [Permianibacter aggregans]|uniref:FHA domain-containing protein n=1 Tax=Permianibacter aggregans TaxID=1510150 RepID=A0A4R6USR8_9GAMM|nr:FHA domain-containing protein [Permianibacter aggregans]QGX40544.1 FHA domain-containing protein [Permianibacter aggregans]TDQ49306.1 FHA domain-containing protein [Permianibacter aggregans]